MKDERFHPINRNVTITVIIYILLMIAVISIATYRIYTGAFYERYKTQMESIITYAQQYIDDDDMSACAETFEESEKYKETREKFDNFVDNYADLHYLYIVRVMEPGDPVGLRSILAANSTYEKENEPENLIYIGDGDADWYSEETTEKFREILNGTEDVFFVQESAWGVDYTLARPLIDSSGRHYGVLCVDVAGDELKNQLFQSMFMNIAVIVCISTVMVLILLWWIRVHVTLPLKRLEDSVKEYAESLQTPRNPDDLLYSPPEIKINNEIKSLSQSISAMSVNIRDYAKKITAVSKEVEGLQGYVSKINNVAYSDPLTRVKNRAAYENACGELIDDIYNMNARFAIVMADVNNLKKINDQYGHDRGNEYIVGVCRILSDIYKRSPIYRVGGDEFVIVLEGKDYDNRDVLRRTANEELMKTACDTTADPWKRYSAAIGMAVYEKGRDMSVEEVFKRADEDMYAVKVKMKAKRE